MLARRLPAIVFGYHGESYRGLATVVADSVMVGQLAAEHLLDCGFQHFAFYGLEDAFWSDQRSVSFQRHIAAAGFPSLTYLSSARAAGRPWKDEHQRLIVWLKSLPKPVGLMACNDDLGQQVIEACKSAGLAVPDDVAILGADNDELVCELSDPPLSSVVINFEQAGYESARLLDRLMRGQRVTQEMILARSSHVVARQSTDIINVSDPAVARSLRFVREHAREAIQVADAVRASGLSRRVLEKRFRALLGRSILSEIRRVRVGQICRMLTETNHPISEIALALGYTSIEHIARYFRSEKKLTPLAYRKQFGPK